MTNTEQKLLIASSPYLKVCNACKLFGIAVSDSFKDNWDLMCKEYRREIGREVPFWGVPTKYVLKYFGFEIDLLEKRYENEKRFNPSAVNTSGMNQLDLSF